MVSYPRVGHAAFTIFKTGVQEGRGREAEGKERLEAQMIFNHKDAIELLINAADDIGFNRYTILNLHVRIDADA